MRATRASRAVASLLTWLMLSSLAPASVAAVDAPLPSSMAAIGDSITQAASSAGSLGADAPQNSWSTGTSTTVNSHYLRLLAAGAPVSGRAYNRSVSGAKAFDLVSQMATVVPLQPDYLTILIGGNDLCTDTVGEMTQVPDFRAQIDAALAALASGSRATRVYLSSIPNVYQLWNLFKGNFWARFIWATASICQSLLANPTSTQAADVQRREQVRLRNLDYNAQLAQACAAHPNCLWDGNAAFNTAFTTGDVSGDYFHPSVAGQAKLASVSWSAGYRWVVAPPENQPPMASFTSSCSGLSCTFADTSTDDSGTIASRSWTFGDGALASTATATHAYATGGTYTVALTVTDGGGLSATTTSQVTVTNPPPPTPMWLSGLSGSSTTSGSSWTATATVAVSSAAGGVSGVTASGTWSTGSSGSCLTTAAGTCTISRSVNKKTGSVSFTVTGLSRAGYAYDSTRNTAPILVTIAKR